MEKVFSLNIRTIAHVAKALLLDKPDELMGVHQGRRKLTPEFAAFVEAMCDTAFQTNPRDYSRILMN